MLDAFHSSTSEQRCCFFFFFFSPSFGQNGSKQIPAPQSFPEYVVFFFFLNNEHLIVSLIYISEHKLHVLKVGRVKTNYHMLADHSQSSFVYLSCSVPAVLRPVNLEKGWKDKVNNKSKHMCLRYWNYYINKSNKTLRWYKEAKWKMKAAAEILVQSESRYKEILVQREEL